MSQATIQSLIEQVRNETQLHGNTRGRIASLLTQLNSEKTDRADVESIISEITNLSPLFFDQFGNILSSLTAGWTEQTAYEADGTRLVKKITGYTGATGTIPEMLSVNIGKYYKADGTLTTVKAEGANFKGAEGVAKYEAYDSEVAYPTRTQVLKDKSLYLMKPDYLYGMPAGTNPETSSAFLKISSEIRHKADTVAGINDNINFPADTLAIVTNDPNPNNNGIYKKISGEYSGGWLKTNFVNPVWAKPETESIAIGGGHTSIFQDEEGTGQGHTAFGFEAGQNLSNCWATTLMGWKAGASLTGYTTYNTWSGENGNTGNSFFGYNVGTAANGALDNSFFGTSAGQNLTTGMDNCGFGIWSLRHIEAGAENSGFGHGTLDFVRGKGRAIHIDSIVTDPLSPEYCWGHRNTAFGDQAGRLDTGGNELIYVKKNVYVGAQTRGTEWSYNENAFGYGANGRGTNTVSIGNHQVKETHFYGILANWTDRRFADLPTPNRALVGARSFILDANTRAFDIVVSGGGSNLMPVWCDGSSWRIG